MILTLCALALVATLVGSAVQVCSLLSRMVRKIDESTEILRHELQEIRRNIATECLASTNRSGHSSVSTAEMSPTVKEWAKKVGYKDPADGLLPKD